VSRRRWSLPFLLTPDQLRYMYAGQRGNVTARRYARFWSTMFAAGVVPRRWVTLEVRGRTSGRLVRFPLGYADLDGNRYLVSMLGQDCNWVKNVRAAKGSVTLRHGRAERCWLIDVPVAQRAPVIKQYLHQVSGARPHIPVDRHADLRAFESIAADYPVFRVSHTPERP
jgi:hypothetical protein